MSELPEFLSDNKARSFYNKAMFPFLSINCIPHSALNVNSNDLFIAYSQLLAFAW